MLSSSAAPNSRPASAPRPSALLALALLLAAGASAVLRAAPPDKNNTILLEPETFAARGGWEITEGNESSDLTTATFVRSAGTGGSVLAGFTTAAAGNYKVWALSRDYASYSPGTRRFGVWIDNIAPDAESGAHGAEGWRWELVKTLTLAAGNHIIEIKHISSNGRCEALLITSADLDPGDPGVTRASLNIYTQTPRQAARVPISTASLQTPVITGGADGVAAELQNAALTLRFRRAQTASGQNVLLREIIFAANASDADAGNAADPAAGQTWRAPLEPVHLIASSADPAANVNRETRWNSTATEDWQLDGAAWTLPADSRNAFLAGTARACYLPESVIPSPAGSATDAATDAAGVTLLYKLQQETAPAALAAGLPAEITVAWSLPETGFAARMEPSLTTARAGWYSLAFAAGGAGGFADADVTALQLPPIYQFRRAPDVPVLLVSSLTPHPLALVETAATGTTATATAGTTAAPLTHGVIADPGELTTEWASRENSTHGFSLRGRENNLQPSVFAPVLGGRGSRLDAGAGLRAAWWVMTSPRPWLETMRDADTGILKFRDYREPWAASLTTQAINIIKLMKSGPAFRWYENLKGPSNIEGATTATQSSPLMLVSAARLARDPEFYKTRGIPSLEYALSRPTWHFANSIENSFMNNEADTRLSFENRSYGAALWQGFDDLLGSLNPWLRDYMIKNGKPRSSNSGDVPVWSEKLALYRSAPSPELLAEITNDAKAWADDAFDNPAELPRRADAFYNLQLYPYWWDLLDLYELTGDPGLITRARQGAALTVAGQWVQPIVPENETMTLNAGNQLTVARTQWWDGDVRRRLGWPDGWQPGVPITLDLPEHDVPAWLPATAGLSLEGPGTYFNSGSFYNMQNTVWAANLIRLAARTGEDYWRAHARNALIGRGSNYPGYYMAGYTDVTHDPANPDTGPDLTAFYWHHAPVHLASIIDFIFTDADARTGGAIRFPYAKSQGYVWFSSRVYGGKPGRVFDDPACWPWLDNIKFNVDTPKVDYLGAQSAGKFHIILLNQARAGATDAKVYIDAAALGIAPDSPARLRTGAGDNAGAGVVSTLAAGAGGTYAVTLAHRGWAVLTFDAATPADPWPACPPLDEKPVTAATGDAGWGDMHAFRIRSPHGADSFYAGLTGVPDGGKMTLLFEDITGATREIATKTDAPYEISAHDIPFGDDIRFKLRLESAGSGEITTATRLLRGTAPAAPSSLSAADLGGGRARLSWTPTPGALSYNIKRAASPGGPFLAIAAGIPAPDTADAAAPGYTDGGLADNQVYYYKISAVNIRGESPDSAPAAVGITNPAAPQITAHPLAQSTPYGTQITLSVSVSSAETGLLYQWLRDGVEIPGATAATLTLAGVPADAGAYRVRLTGANGSTLSAPAAVTITPADAGALSAPASVAVDAAGLLYVSDEENHAIHILTPPGSSAVYINTFAGSPGLAGATDATGTQARFNRPLGLVARDHILYVADFANGSLRTITTGREVGTLAAAALGGPAGITTDAAGNLYAADKTAHVIRKIEAATGAPLIIAGQPDNPGADDGDATRARFNAPAGLAWTPGTTAAGILYIADTGNHIIRKLDLGDAARVTTLAGNAGVPGWADGAGDDVLFDSPEGIIADIDGTLYIADTGNSLIREIAPGGWVGTVAGDADAGALAGVAGFKDATGTAALFDHPRGVALGRDGELYIADTGNRAIRRIDLANNVQTLLPIAPAQPPEQPPDTPGGSDGGSSNSDGSSNGDGGKSGSGSGGGSLPAWYFTALSALFATRLFRRAI